MPRPRIYDEALRARLIAAAAATMATQGSEGLSLRVLAADADTSTTAIYTLFGNKEALVEAVLQEGHESLMAAQMAVPRTDDVAADFIARGLAYRAWALKHWPLYAVMFGLQGPLNQRSLQEVETAMAPLTEAVERGMDSGLLRRGDVGEVAISIWASAHGILSLEIAGFLDPAGAEERYLQQLLASASFWLSR